MRRVGPDSGAERRFNPGPLFKVRLSQTTSGKTRSLHVVLEFHSPEPFDSTKEYTICDIRSLKRLGSPRHSIQVKIGEFRQLGIASDSVIPRCIVLGLKVGVVILIQRPRCLHERQAPYELG